MPTTTTTASKVKEEATSTTLKKTKKLFRKFRPHRQTKGAKTPPAVVNVNNNNTTAAPSNNAPPSTRSSLQPKTLFHDTKTKTTSSTSTKPLKSSYWLSHSKWFTKLSNAAFDVVDADSSGTVDEKELYSGLLLIHLKLGCYAGPAACRPVDRQRVHDVFMKMDADGSGGLDRDEFRQVMMVLCSNVVTRVMVQWSMTLIIVPLVAQYILNALYFINHHFWKFLSELDEYSPIMDAIECWMEDTRDAIIAKLPRVVMASWHMIAKVVDKVPESVWNTVPLTLLSCILGCLAVPYIIFKIDDYFQAMADEKRETVEKEQSRQQS